MIFTSKLDIHTFCIGNTFINNARLKLTKSQVNAKQHPETELLLFENYIHIIIQNNTTYSKKIAIEQVRLYSWDYRINHNENEDENEKIDHINTT